jgi:hypothetical protein
MSTPEAVPVVSAMPPVTRRVRAYFAPVDRVQQRATIFDPATDGWFNLDAPPAPWADLGWIENFVRKSGSTLATLATGRPAATQLQVREQLGATVSFRFKTWSKLSMALAAGSEHMNLLATTNGVAVNGSGGRAVEAVNVLAGSTGNMLCLEPGVAGGFCAGDMVVVDVDYAGQTGFVGSAVSAAYVTSATAVNNDVDYVRRVTFNVARVATVSDRGLELSQSLIAGPPTAEMKIQKMLGFVDREGGSFFQEWSGLFVMPGEQGERILFYYPRLQAMTGAQEAAQPLSGPLERIALAANFHALPVTDANDGQQVVCFRSFLPGPGTLL